MKIVKLLNETDLQAQFATKYLAPGTKCDDCGSLLTDDERVRNMQENKDQDGNAITCCSVEN